jgi:sortase A
MLDLEQVAQVLDDAVAPVTADEARARAGSRTHFHRTAVLVSAVAVLLVGGAVAGGLVALGVGRHSTVTVVRGNETTTTAKPSASVVPLGTAIGRVVIFKTDVDQTFYEGARAEDERKGPIHDPASPMPGQAGNVVIAGHRTTYGAPFLRLDELQPGDVIQLTTDDGGFTYIVDSKPFVMAPQGDSLFPQNILGRVACGHGTHSLTLITNAPKYSAAQRLVVTARIGTEPVKSCAA